MQFATPNEPSILLDLPITHLMVVAQGEIVRRILQNCFFKWVLAPVAVLCGLGWGYFQINYPTCTFRYKLTAEVITPDGLKTGSSVIEVSYSHYPDSGGGPSANLGIVGEAVYVDLGSGKNLFVTLTSAHSGRNTSLDSVSRNFENSRGPMSALALPLKVFNFVWHFGQEHQLCSNFASLGVDRIGTVSFENFPTIVTFRQLEEPNSLEVVQPENLSTVLGSGFSFGRLTITPTKDQFGSKLSKTLRWLEPMRTKELNIRKSGHTTGFPSDPIIEQLGTDTFIQPGTRGHPPL